MKRLFYAVLLALLSFTGAMAQTYTVAGSAAILNGTASWDPTNTENDMVAVEDGVWQLVVENCQLEADNYEYKVVEDHAWTVSYPADNAVLAITETALYTVTFTLNDTGKGIEVNAGAVKTGDWTPSGAVTLTVAGSSKALLGSEWDPADTNNDMALVGDNLYELKKLGVELSEGTIEYKVAKDHNWGSAWPSSNASFVVPKDGVFNVTFSFNYATKEVNAEVTAVEEPIVEPVVIETMSIVGELTGGWPDGEDWSMAKPMLQDTENANIWSLTLEGVALEAGSYKYKAVANNKWGDYELPASGDQVCEITEAGTYNLTFTADTENHKLTLVTDKLAVVTFTDLLTLPGAAEYTEGKAFMIEAESGSATIKVTSGETVLTEIMEDGVAMVEITGNAFTSGEFTISADKELTLTKVSLLDNPDAAEGTQIWPAIEEPVVIETMSIVGELTGGWPTDTDWSMAKAMTQDPDNANLWTLTMENVELEAKTYQYKATANGKWGDYELPANGNNECTIAEAGTYTLTFTADTEAHTLNVLAEKQAVTTFVDLLTLEGKAEYTEGKAFMIEAESGSATIKLTSGETVLTETMEDGVAMVEITGNAFTSGEFTISADKELTLTKVSLLDNPDAAEGTQIWPAIEEPVVIETMSIVGELTGGWPTDTDWSMAKAMTQDPDNANLWTLTMENVELEAKTYQYKATANGKWGDYELPANGNNECTIAEAGTYTLTFTADTEAHTLNVLAEKQAVTTFVDLLTLEGKAEYTEGKAFMIEAESGSATIKLTSGETVLTETMEDGVAMVEITGNAFTSGEFTISADKELTLTKVSLLDNPDAAEGTQIWPAIEEPVVIETMSIVGELTGGWPTDTDWSMAKAMTQDPDNANLWTLTMENVELEAKTYQYKATANGKWGDYELPANGNNECTIAEAGTYTLTFTADTEAHTLNVLAEKQAVVTFVDLLTLPGAAEYTEGKAFMIEAESGSATIKVTSGETVLTEIMEDGVAMVEITGNAFTSGEFTISADKELTLTKVSLLDNPDAAEGTQIWPAIEEPVVIETMSIVGELTGGWPTDTDWSMAKAMTQDPDNANLWTLTVDEFAVSFEEGSESRTYAYKATANGKWGDYELPAEGNNTQEFTEEGNYKLVFTADTELHTLTLEATRLETPVENAVIATVELRGAFNSWSAGQNMLTATDTENTYQGVLDLTDIAFDQEFKLVVNAEGGNGDIWLGGNQLTMDAPEGWIAEVSDGANFKLLNSTTGYQTYTFTATWTPSPDAAAGWTLKIEGLDEREEIKDAEITHVQICGATDEMWQNRIDFDLAPADEDNAFGGLLDLTASTDDVQFKLVVNDNNWIGTNQLTLDAPEGWVVNEGYGGNFTLTNSTAGYQTYTFTATWTPSPDPTAGWTLKIEGKDERVVEIPDAVITNVELRGQFNEWAAGTTVLEPTDVENVYEGTLDLSATKDDQEFKLVVNAEGVENDIWIGNGSDTQFDAPEGWIVGLEDGDWNYVMKNSTTGYQTYTVTATWTPSSDAGKGWTLKIEGKDERIATGIEAWRTEFCDGHYYNLQGVRITNPKRGVYIHNGHKVVVK